MVRAYVYARVADELSLKVLRDQLWVAVDAEEYYKMKEPHITIIPPFSIKDNTKLDIKNRVSETELVGKDVEVKTLSVYENIHKPYVVQLDIGVDFNGEIKSLQEDLSQYCSSRIKDPASPHITLFKTQGWWDEIPREQKRILQNELISRKLIKDTSISKIEVNFR